MEVREYLRGIPYGEALFERYLAAKELVRLHQDARTAFLMKRLHPGHGAAARVMDRLEISTVVAPACRGSMRTAVKRRCCRGN
ncbi:hypothetical protein F2Q65_12945 [Thiohalocapsa marina]|uniref:Transposase n=1 Tax=Thiohalocapsa marina TaxID=424902 RepID=A0A5M8FJU3_9GAMM|nr:hypothetical protein F2Q65_12945 [Thiohalocapsa marina]